MIFLDTLNVVIGPTGSGKSLFELLLAELFIKSEDPRPIVTTLAIDLPRFAEWMQEKHPEAPGNLAARIIRIYKKDLATFWRVRGIQNDGEYGYQAKRLGYFGGPDWQIALPGVIYLLDEAQVCFKAREFMKNSGEFLDYQPQARKLNDTILAVSPASSLLDKAFRDLANQCIVLSNLYKVRIKGFTAPRKIVARAYLNCPPVKGEEETAKHEFTIDAKGLASCYKTQEGVGVTGIGADIGRVARGIPWWAIIPMAIGIGFLIYFVLTRGMHATAKWGFRHIAISDKSAQAAAGQLYRTVSPSAVPSPFGSLSSTGAVHFVPLAPPPPVAPPPPRQAHAKGFAVLDGVLYLDTRLGMLSCPAGAWTNNGDTISARGMEWTIDPSLTHPVAPGFHP